MREQTYLFPVKKIALVMRVSCRGYYSYLKHDISKTERGNIQLKKENPIYLFYTVKDTLVQEKKQLS